MIVDMMMPGMSGLEVLATSQQPVHARHSGGHLQRLQRRSARWRRAATRARTTYWVKVSMRLDEICRRIDGYFVPGDDRQSH
jgi:hypothetical protein